MDAFLRTQPSMVEISIPDDGKFTVCGDIHGQFYDLLNIFEKNGLPSEVSKVALDKIIHFCLINIHLIFRKIRSCLMAILWIVVRSQ